MNYIDQKNKMLSIFQEVVSNFQFDYLDLCDYGPFGLEIKDEMMIEMSNFNSLHELNEVEQFINLNIKGKYNDMGLVVDLCKEEKVLTLCVSQPRMSNAEFASLIGD